MSPVRLYLYQKEVFQGDREVISPSGPISQKILDILEYYKSSHKFNHDLELLSYWIRFERYVLAHESLSKEREEIINELAVAERLYSNSEGRDEAAGVRLDRAQEHWDSWYSRSEEMFKKEREEKGGR
jgi:hypothetical protein